jgi:dephospho-CoA kinase
VERERKALAYTSRLCKNDSGRMHVFGLTGGIGSGKSTVANRLRARGVPMVDADELARAVVRAESPALAEIVARFGAEVLRADGELDRAALAGRVFSAPEERAALEAITHPRIRAAAQQQFAEFAAAREPLAGYDVPLLYERGLERDLGSVIVVDAPEELRVARAVERDQVDPQRVRARIAAQLPLASKVARADLVIDNSGTLADTWERTDRALLELCRRVGVAPARYGL